MSDTVEEAARLSPDRFSGDLLWLSLSPEAQAAIGAAALEVVAARNTLDETFPGGPRQTPAHRAAEAAMDAADEELDAMFVLHVAKRHLFDDEDRVKLPSIIGLVCLACGCSENDACDEGCGWAERDLCTACRDQNVHAPMLAALTRAEAFVAGFVDVDLVNEIRTLHDEISAAIRLNAHAPMLAALKRAEAFVAGFVDADFVNGIHTLHDEIRAAIRVAEGASS